ncbi:MAG: indole-3-glycerol phosphate synthase TrpC [Solirubrobacteraceae bacterium]
MAPILARTRADVERARRQADVGELRAAAARRLQEDPPRGFAAALRQPGLAVIAEHKRRSPSAGTIRLDLELEDVVCAYERGGARALSVLTEEHSFGGSLDDLRRARQASSLPILRKDFVVDPYQVAESAAAGADAILLIVAALDGIEALRELHEAAAAYRLDALVEVHDAAELEVAAELGAAIVGINNRNLSTLAVEPETTFRLLGDVPDGAVTVSESGWRTASELAMLHEAGVDAVLIGEALMRADDVEAACRGFSCL